MKAMAAGHDVSRPGELPPLSRNFQTTQLLTPRQLERITIDNSHYANYLDRAVQTEPPHLNPLQRRTQKVGDGYFYIQKDIPLRQQYVRTALSLSVNRPWDQIVARPLSSYRVLQMELGLPFPAKHPYSSHISQFAVFPDSDRGRVFPPQTEIEVLRDVSTQTSTRHCTAPTHGHLLPPYYVTQKASERGVRVECRHLSVPAGVDMTRERRKLWDMPRSQRHLRSQTYPAPALQYSLGSTSPMVSPRTQHGLDTIHKLVARTTTYAENFPRPSVGPQNVLRINKSSTRSQSHERPFTAESRGKYSRGLSAVEKFEGEYEEEDIEDVFGRDAELDKATQTDFEDFEMEDAHEEHQHKLPEIAIAQPGHLHHALVATGNRPVTAGTEIQRSRARDDMYTPRLAVSSRRLMGLYDGFSRTEVQKRFHSQFPEQAPDLRENSIREGKRHIIHGHHAYYFH